MRSPLGSRDSDHPRLPSDTVQDTLDAFAPADVIDPHGYGEGPGAGDADLGPRPSRQESIDAFSTTDGGPAAAPPSRPFPARAVEGLALEMEMERVALTEAARGIPRDELLLTIARQVELPLERLDLVDGYLSDLELEGRVRRHGDLVVGARDEDEDLHSMDLTDDEFLARYRRRHPGGGGEAG